MLNSKFKIILIIAVTTFLIAGMIVNKVNSESDRNVFKIDRHSALNVFFDKIKMLAVLFLSRVPTPGPTMTPSPTQTPIPASRYSAPSPSRITATNDNAAPKVNSFNVQPQNIAIGQFITASFTVTDTGGSFIKSVSLRRAPYKSSGCNNSNQYRCVWLTVKTANAPAQSNSWTSTLQDNPGIGTWWYGLGVFDGTGKVAYEPATIKITVSSSAPTPTPTPTSTPGTIAYPLHTSITATVFWVGEPVGNGSSEDNAISAYDDYWQTSYGGFDDYSYIRSATNNYFPNGFTPKENPFYLDLPFDDINNSTAYNWRVNIPWYTGNTSREYSYMKNRWVKMTKGTKTCYGQIEDAGPYVYNDSAYVFGTNDARPKSTQANNAGMDVSPALRDCLGFIGLNNADNKINWQFVEAVDVPNGPWKIVVTISQVNQP